MNEPIHLDLFSGIGGFALAAQWNGYRTVGFCERDEYCQAVLRKHFPRVPIHGDIRELDGKQYRGVDILTGGFSCQPFSHTGKQKGKEDDRYLWPEMLRIIQQAQPTFILGENVAGIINLALDQVLFDLEGAGYTAQPFIIPACAVDAPHRRDRVWIVAYANNISCHSGKQGKSRESELLQAGKEAFNTASFACHLHSAPIRCRGELRYCSSLCKGLPFSYAYPFILAA